MKSFSEYLLESSQKTYDFKVKIAMRVDDDTIEKIESALKAVDLASIGKPTFLPIQVHREFPSRGPIEASLIEVSVHFPVNEEKIKNLIAERGFIPLNALFVYTKGQYDLNSEVSPDTEFGSKDAILTKELEAGQSAQDQVGDKRVSGFLKELQTQQFDIEGGKTAKANTTNDLPQGTDSPFSKVKRK